MPLVPALVAGLLGAHPMGVMDDAAAAVLTDTEHICVKSVEGGHECLLYKPREGLPVGADEWAASVKAMTGLAAFAMHVCPVGEDFWTGSI